MKRPSGACCPLRGRRRERTRASRAPRAAPDTSCRSTTSTASTTGAWPTTRPGASTKTARSYFWDDFSALVAVKDSGSLEEALQYDGLGRLVARWTPSGLVEELAYDGAQMVGAWDAASNVRWSATWAPGIDALLSIADGTGEYLALEDGKANVVAYLNADDSQLAGTAQFTPEGREQWKDFRGNTSCAEKGNSRCKPLLNFPFGFHGAYKSPGTGLVYFRNRWYSTEAGQWLSQDPLGYVDSFNLYAFNRFDPVNFVDPWGLGTGPAHNHKQCGEDQDSCVTYYPETTVEVEKPVEVPVEEEKEKPACDSECQDRRERRAASHAARAEAKREPRSEPASTTPPAQPSQQRPTPPPPPRPAPAIPAPPVEGRISRPLVKSFDEFRRLSPDEIRKFMSRDLEELNYVQLEKLTRHQARAVADVIGGGTGKTIRKYHEDVDAIAQGKGFEAIVRAVPEMIPMLGSLELLPRRERSPRWKRRKRRLSKCTKRWENFRRVSPANSEARRRVPQRRVIGWIQAILVFLVESPEAGPHINWWDYTAGKRGRGGASGAIPIIE